MKPGNKSINHKAKLATRTVNHESKIVPLKSMIPWYMFVFLFSFLLYAGTIGHKYVLDDNGAIKTNWVVKKGVSGIPLILKTPYRYGVSMLNDNLYRPLSLIMFALEWQVAPGKPLVGHLINVLFYALTCALLLLVLSKLFHRFNPAFALFACLLWMVHPVHTEVVANIKSRDEIMSVFFLLLSVHWLLSYLKNNSRVLISGCLVAYFFALMSKEGVITFLFIMPLIGWYVSEKGRPAGIWVTVLFLIPAIAYLLIRQAVLTAWATPATNTLLDNLLLAAPDIQSRLATAILLLGKYLFLLILPLQLVSDYSYNQIPVTFWSDPYVLISFIVYAALLVYAIWKVKERSILAFGILFFLVTISIYSNLFMLIGSSFAERFLYLPSIGFCIAFIAGIMFVFRVNEKEQYTPVLRMIIKKLMGPSILIVLIMVLFTIKTISRNMEWKDEYTLFSCDVERSPNSAHMRLYWGTAIRDKAKEENDPQLYKDGIGKALEEFKKAAEIYPSYPDAWQQMGLAYYRLGENERSMESYQKALSLNPREPTTYANMGIIFFQKGDFRKAIELYQQAIQLDPNYADAYFNLGSSFGMIGEFTKAADNFHKCLELDPENARACYYLGITYKSLNNPSESQRFLKRAAQLDPSMVQ